VYKLIVQGVPHIFNLEKSVGRTSIAQALDSLGYMKKMLITNKVTTHFFITPFKSTSDILHALPTAFSRIKPFRLSATRRPVISAPADADSSLTRSPVSI